MKALFARLSRALQSFRIPYMLVGGQAVAVYGYPRFTQDVDITLGVAIDAYSVLRKVCEAARLEPAMKEVKELVQKMHVLPMQDRQTGFRVDFIFSSTPYERQAIERAHSIRIGNAKVRVATLEDLLIHKLVAGRAVDVEDAKVLIRKNSGKIDSRYIRRWLRQFRELGTLKEDPLALFDQLRRKSS